MSHESLNLSASARTNRSEARFGTRIRYQIQITLSDPTHPSSEPCFALLVNPQGCAARFCRALEIGTAVQLQGLPGGVSVTARVVNCIKIEECARFWLLGLALDKAGNVWGVETPPEDWADQAR
jgi:hypothetical protein